jgi:hypothetical protein
MLVDVCLGVTRNAVMYATNSLSQFAPTADFRQPVSYSTGSRFGDAVIIAFLISQLLDGIFTYSGIIQFGPGIEANPIISWLMRQWGEGPALALAKVMAGAFGVALHLVAVHRVVFALTAFYIAGAILPWTIMLFV